MSSTINSVSYQFCLSQKIRQWDLNHKTVSPAVNQLFKHWASQLMNQTVSSWVNQPYKQLASQLINQTVSRADNQPFKQVASQLHKIL